MIADALSGLTGLLDELGRLWATSPHRPRPTPLVLQGWDNLLEAWADTDLPLLLRDSRRRGDLTTNAEGRAVLFADNTPANWSFGKALDGLVPDLASWSAATIRDDVPITMLTRGAFKRDLNRAGWKVCHIDPVSDRTRTRVETIPTAELKVRFKRFMSPRNMFLVPKSHAGMGELPEVILAIREFEQINSAAAHI